MSASLSVSAGSRFFASRHEREDGSVSLALWSSLARFALMPVDEADTGDRCLFGGLHVGVLAFRVGHDKVDASEMKATRSIGGRDGSCSGRSFVAGRGHGQERRLPLATSLADGSMSVAVRGLDSRHRFTIDSRSIGGRAGRRREDGLPRGVDVETLPPCPVRPPSRARRADQQTAAVGAAKTCRLIGRPRTGPPPVNLEVAVDLYVARVTSTWSGCERDRDQMWI